MPLHPLLDAGLKATMCLSLSLPALAQSVALAPPKGLAFDVVSTRRMSREEVASRTPPDVIGLDVVIRLRLSTTDRGVWLLVPKEPATLQPRVLAVKVEATGVTWRFGSRDGRSQSSSPGIDRITESTPMAWVALPAHSAIEWEECDSSSTVAERRAFTTFIKDGRSGAPREILSGTYEVPVRPGEWSE